jgi:TP901 family phage tail tape measure protein
MPGFSVFTAFKAKDKQIRAAWKRMTKDAQIFGKTSADAFDRASRSGKRFKGITSGILKAGAVQRGLGLVQRGLGEVVTQFISFDDAITGAAARFKDIGPGAKDFEDRLAALKKRAREAGATTEFTATQAAESLDFLARAGFTSTEAMKSLNSMINLSTASGEDFARVADISSDLLGAFGLASKNTAQKMKNLNRLNDVLVKSANSANVTIESQFETMKVAAPIFAIFGDNLEQVASITAAMGNAGIKGSQGATALKNAILRLAAPTPKVMDGMAKLGLRMDDISTIGKDGKRNMKPMIEILKTMKPLLDKLGTKETRRYFWKTCYCCKCEFN